MSAVLKEVLGALGDLGFTHSWDPILYDLLAEGALVRFRWGESDGQVFTQVITRRGGDARLGIILGGRDPRILLGVDNRGPVITKREFIAGTNRLSNGDFALLEDAIPTHAQLWSYMEGTAWQATGTGLAQLVTTIIPTRDDILTASEQPEAAQGQTWEATADVAWPDPYSHPEGKLRLRLTMFGIYDTPNLAADGGVVIDEIPKPQLFNFGAGPVTLGPSMTFSAGALIAGPNPRPTYNPDAGFETSTGWSDVTTPPPMSDDIDLVNLPAEAAEGTHVMRVGPVTQHNLIQNSTFNIDLANWYMSSDVATPDPGLFYWHATDGVDGSGGATTAGTVTPVPLAIADQSEFDAWMSTQPHPFQSGPNGTSYATFEANSLADPNRRASGYKQDFNGTWITDAAVRTGVGMAVLNRATLASWLASQPNGTSYATFEANDLADPNRGAAGYIQDFEGSWVLDYRHVKYLRADSSDGTAGVQAYDVKPGEQYKVGAKVRRSPAANGFAYISAHIPHPTVANREEWFTSASAKSEELPGETFEPLEFTVDIPDNRFKMDLLFEVHEHSIEYWTVDNYLVTRTRGNRAEIQSDTTTTVVPGTRYQGDVLVRAGGDMQVGSVRVGYILTGAGVEPRRVEVDKGFTDYEWTSVPIDFTPEDGYTDARRFVAGLDIVGESMWIDRFQTTRMNNNSDTSTWAPVAVIEDQRYLLQVDAEVLGATEGSLTVGVKLTGPAVNPEYIPLKFDAKDNAGVNSLHTDVTPPPGYTEARLYAQSTDILGGTGIKVHRATLTKMDNNSVIIAVDTLDLTPERTYRWTKNVSSTTSLRRGSVKLVARCMSPGRPDQTFPSAALVPPEDGSHEALTFEFTPPSGYNQVVRTIVATDVEGASITLGLGEVRDTDSSTKVFDAIGGAGDTELAVSAEAPEGTEKVAAALVGEAGSFSWLADNVWLHRINEPTYTAAEVVDELLHDPITGEYRLLPGDIYGDDALLHDWTPERQSLRTALQHLSTSGLVTPLREDRVTADLRYHWGTAEQLYTERGSLVLTRSRVIVREGIGVERNNEERVDRVEIIGATKADARGRPVQIIGVAENDWGAGNPDTLVLEDSSADHVAYANSLARYHLDRVSTSIVNVTGSLVNWQSIENFDNGDWVFPENRDAGLEGADAVDLAGETVFPERMRVVARTLRMGRDWSAEVLNPITGGWVALAGVAWEKETSCDVELGTPLPNFLADPQHGAAVVQFNRFRLSAGR